MLTDPSDRLILLCSRTVSLLYYMVCSPTPKYNLSQRLHNVDPRQFNGLMHVFSVTFGRFSFADTPEWVRGPGKQQLEQLAGQLTFYTSFVSG